MSIALELFSGVPIDIRESLVQNLALKQQWAIPDLKDLTFLSLGKISALPHAL